MIYEQDYIMRMIKQVIAALVSVILGKENTMVDLPLEDQYKSSEGMLHDLLTMVNDQRINEAENMLYEKYDFANKKDVEDAIMFYSYLNKLDDEFLIKCNFSRDEIELGLKKVASLSGMQGFVEAFDQLEM